MRALAVLVFAFFLSTVAHGSRQPESPSQAPYQPPAEEIVESVQQPWVEPLTELYQSMSPGKNYVFWILSPPKHPLDLRTAEAFRRFINGNAPAEPSISHNMVAWSCPGARSGGLEGAVGMTGETRKQAMTMLKSGFGLTTFLSVFTDGEIDGTEAVAEVVSDLQKETGLVILGAEVAASQCESMVDFLETFLRHPNKPHRRFGLTVRPEKMEGGGCISLATALLKKAGVMENLFPLAERELIAPRALMGGNLPKPAYTQVPRLPWLGGAAKEVRIGWLQKTSWLSHEGGIALNIPDPEMLILLMKAVWEARLAALPGAVAARERQQLAHTALGERVVRSADDDGGASIGFQLRYFQINERFDGQAGQLVRAAQQWTSRNLSPGSVRLGTLLGQPVLVMHR